MPGESVILTLPSRESSWPLPWTGDIKQDKHSLSHHTIVTYNLPIHV